LLAVIAVRDQDAGGGRIATEPMGFFFFARRPARLAACSASRPRDASWPKNPAFRHKKAAIFAAQPEYSRLYSIVGALPTWKHATTRKSCFYDARSRSNAKAAKAEAELGSTSIRAGQNDQATAWPTLDPQLPARQVTCVSSTRSRCTNGDRQGLRDGSPPRLRHPLRSSERRCSSGTCPTLLVVRSIRLQRATASAETAGWLELSRSRELSRIRTGGTARRSLFQGVCFGQIWLP